MWKAGLKIIATNPTILGEVLEKFGTMPNIETSTMGGSFFWEDIENLDGWRIQKNKVMGNCRILDPNDIRKGWGGESAVKKAFKYIIKNYSTSTTDGNNNNSINQSEIIKLIRDLSDLKDKGIITDSEFQNKKNKLLSQIG